MMPVEGHPCPGGLKSLVFPWDTPEGGGDPGSPPKADVLSP